MGRGRPWENGDRDQVRGRANTKSQQTAPDHYVADYSQGTRLS
jgi:hypothetical protein